MAIGRLFCVALPFVLTAASLICLLVATLAGVTDKNLHLFRVNVTSLAFDPTTLNLDNLVESPFAVRPRSPIAEGWHDDPTIVLVNRQTVPTSVSDAADLVADAGSDVVDDVVGDLVEGNGNNITAADLGLGDLYDIHLWGYCKTTISSDGEEERECEDPAFDYASNILNSTLTQLRTAAALTGNADVDLPSSIEDALEVFAVVSKYTQIAYIAALGGLAVALLFGLLATCSRAFGCVTFLIASISSVLVLAAASLSTATSVVIVGVVEGTAKWYGVRSNFNVTFLAFSWSAVGFAIGAAFFWMFTVCCCATSHPASRKAYTAKSMGPFSSSNVSSSGANGGAEKGYVPTGSYQPLGGSGESHEMQPPFYSSGQQYAGGYGGNNRNQTGAYEPYSHNQV